MPWSSFELFAYLPAFLLVLCRVSGLMLTAPLFSSALIPSQLKAMMSAAIALTIFPVAVSHFHAPVTLGSAAAGMAGEVAIGILMGFGVTMLFTGVQMAAEAVGQQAGLSLGSVFNPMLDTTTTELSQLYFFVAMMVFLGVGGDHALIRALLDSFSAVPPLGFHVTEGMVAMLIDMMSLSVTVAIRVAGPTILALLLGYMALGFVSRTVPQLNILTVGFPIKLAMAFAVMALTMMSLEPVLLEGLTECVDGLRSCLGLRAM